MVGRHALLRIVGVGSRKCSALLVEEDTTQDMRLSSLMCGEPK